MMLCIHTLVSSVSFEVFSVAYTRDWRDSIGVRPHLLHLISHFLQLGFEAVPSCRLLVLDLLFVFALRKLFLQLRLFMQDVNATETMKIDVN